MILSQQQTLDLYASLELRIKNVQLRNVVYLVSLGWRFFRDKMRRAVCYISNPSWLGLLRLKVKPGAAGRAMKWWLEPDYETDRYVYYRLRTERFGG